MQKHESLLLKCKNNIKNESDFLQFCVSKSRTNSVAKMVLSSFMVSLAELSHVASVASVVTCCLLMLGFLLRLCGQDLLQGVGLNDDRQHNFITKIFASQKQNITNVRPIDLFVGVTKVRF